ncbi:MAG: activator of HSP90 ATPase 1 family protein [Saprospiraceae bacterium]|nr:MAG: activator of HSP90 ATPase 1 family protein [Bacteroidetes bacterium OLB9]MCO6464058.1 activator of HSP90 ATPase 1 family protein [Saprospiraceae bacterium]
MAVKRVRLDLEYIFRASPTILYNFVTTNACLVRWYCDDVDITNDTYTFNWAGSTEVALLIDDIEDERVKFEWEDAAPDEFLEYRMYKSDITNETILEITDFCDEDEVGEVTDFWNNLMNVLHKECGG